jgi:hypothetical protein
VDEGEAETVIVFIVWVEIARPIIVFIILGT